MRSAISRYIANKELPTRECVEVMRGGLLRRWRLGIGAASVLTLAVAMAVLAVLINPPGRVSLVAVGADYAVNLSVPHNAHGWLGLVDLCEYGASASGALDYESLLRTVTAPLVADENFDWEDAVALMKGQAAVLLISMHGGADEAGPYFHRENCSPRDDSSRRLRFSDLLAELQKLPASQPKVIVIDATVSRGSWRYGESQNEFAAGLRSLSSDIEAIPGLVVIASSDEGEQSWRSDRGRTTAFLDALSEAMHGNAEDGNCDGRISLDEALTTVVHRVTRNAASVGRSQTPLRLPFGHEGVARSQSVDIAYSASDKTQKVSSKWTPSKEELQSNLDCLEPVAKALRQPESRAALAWRHYRALLIRREQLLAAGAEQAVQRITSEIDDVEAMLLEASHKANLEHDPVETFSQSTDRDLVTAVDAAFAELWSARGGEHHQVVARMFATKSTEEIPTLRRLLFDRVIDSVYDNPQTRLQQGAIIIDSLRDPLTPLPTDAHLVSVLAEGLPVDLSSPSWCEALRLAIETRRLSVRVFHQEATLDSAYLAELSPWLQARRLAADKMRLQGEDLLFVGGGELLSATSSLQQAKKLYESMSNDASVICGALRARDEAFDLLGFYEDAADSLSATSHASLEEVDSLVSETVNAINAANELSDAILAVETGDSEASVVLIDLPRMTTRVEAAMLKMRDNFRRWRSQLVKRTGVTLELNREAALMTPDLSVGERLRLLMPAVVPASVEESNETSQIVGTDESLDDQKSRRARLAHAIVGKRILERMRDEGGRSQRIGGETILGNALDSDGCSIAACATVAANCLREAESQLSAALPEGVNSEVLRDITIAADTARRLSFASMSDPLRGLLECERKLAFYRFFCQEAERALAEVWSDASPGEAPRYRSVATAYLDAADRLIPGRDARKRLSAAASKSMVWRADAPASVTILPLGNPTFTIKAMSANSPLSPCSDGVAALSLEASKGFNVTGAASDKRFAASMLSEGASAQTLVGVSLIADSKDAPSKGRLKLTGWFRGSRVESTVAVHNLSKPTAEYLEAPRPTGAGVSIVDERSETEIAATGAVAIVLDASGSMGPGDDLKSKYRQATVTLESLLRDLPEGVQVSIWVFGQAVGAGKTTNTPESTITQVFGPTLWGPARDSSIRAAMSRLAYPRVEPWNESPLTRAILMASRDLRSVSGFKTLIAITDGVDNRFGNDSYLNPQGLPIGDVVREELFDANISLQIVAFRVDAPEQVAARQQFRFIEQLTPVGQWWEASQASELERVLRSAFEQSQTAPLYAISEHSPGSADSIAAITKGSEAPAWPREPVAKGVYKLPRLTSSAKPQKALLRDGDLLLVTLTQGNDEQYLTPTSYSVLVGESRRSVETGGWRCSILSDRLLPSGARSTLVTIEKSLLESMRQPILEVARPDSVWFEAADSVTQRISWRRIDGYPSPCWEVIWPAGAIDEQLTVWWNGSDIQKAGLAIRSDGKRPRLLDFVGQSWRQDDESVMLQRLAIEKQLLPDASGQLIEQPSLVVELRAASRCLAMLEGYEVSGRRQQWFDEAQTSITTFWPVTADALDGLIEGIRVVTSEAAKHEAKQVGRLIRFSGTGKPTTDDYHPVPVVNWFQAEVAPAPAESAKRYSMRAR